MDDRVPELNPEMGEIRELTNTLLAGAKRLDVDCLLVSAIKAALTPLGTVEGQRISTVWVAGHNLAAAKATLALLIEQLLVMYGPEKVGELVGAALGQAVGVVERGESDFVVIEGERR